MYAAFKIIRAVIGNMRQQVREVDRKYAKPELEMSTLTKVLLLGLRIYLLAMILMMGWFLIRQMRSLGHG